MLKLKIAKLINFDPVSGTRFGERRWYLLHISKKRQIGIPTWCRWNGGYNYLSSDTTRYRWCKGGLTIGWLFVAKIFEHDNRELVLDWNKISLKNDTYRTNYSRQQAQLISDQKIPMENGWKNSWGFKTSKETLELNKNVLNSLKETCSYEERAAIDTVKQNPQLQSFKFKRERSLS